MTSPGRPMGHFLLPQAALTLHRGLRHNAYYDSPCWSPDGQMIVASDGNGDVYVHASDDLRVLHRLRGHHDLTIFIDVSSDGRFAASGSPDSTVRVWDLVAGKEVVTLEGPYHSVGCVKFSPTGNLLAAHTFEQVHLWRCRDWEQVASIPQLVHQLHLNEIAVALVVFDSRSETDPFSGVKHWVRALAQARRLEDTVIPLRTYLVAARADRGGVAVSSQRVQAMIDDLDLDGFFETSAKEGWQAAELKDAIEAAIAWDALPMVSSSILFDRIKQFLIEEKNQGRVLSTADDLFRGFVRTQSGRADHDALRASAAAGKVCLVGVADAKSSGRFMADLSRCARWGCWTPRRVGWPPARRWSCGPAARRWFR